MPKLLRAKFPCDDAEESQIRRLAQSRHAPGDWIVRARMIVRSWEGLRTTTIAKELGCHPQTVRERIVRFNAEGIDGLGDRPGAGRKPRLTEAERSQIIALAKGPPPGTIVRQSEGTLVTAETEAESHWTLDALVEAAQGRGIRIARSQVRRILRREKVRWRSPHSGGTSTDPDFVPKRTEIVSLYVAPPENGTILALDELGPVIPRCFPPAAGWSADGHRIKAPLEYSRGREKVWVYGALRIRDGHEVTLTARSRNTVGYVRLLDAIEQANPLGDLYLITDNLSSHKSPPVQEWLGAHSRVHHVFIPTGACWLNLQEGWWRLFRRDALAGQTFADCDEIDQVTLLATHKLNQRAKPWVWDRPPRPHRHLRRRLVYCL